MQSQCFAGGSSVVIHSRNSPARQVSSIRTQTGSWRGGKRRSLQVGPGRPNDAFGLLLSIGQSYAHTFDLVRAACSLRPALQCTDCRVGSDSRGGHCRRQVRPRPRLLPPGRPLPPLNASSAPRSAPPGSRPFPHNDIGASPHHYPPAKATHHSTARQTLIQSWHTLTGTGTRITATPGGLRTASGFPHRPIASEPSATTPPAAPPPQNTSEKAGITIILFRY